MPSNNLKINGCLRLEPGCLGPQGDELIHGFCQFANEQLEMADDSLVDWRIVPRANKNLDEFEYHYKERRLPPAMADKLFEELQQPRESIEETFYSDLLFLIEQYRSK